MKTITVSENAARRILAMAGITADASQDQLDNVSIRQETGGMLVASIRQPSDESRVELDVNFDVLVENGIAVIPSEASPRLRAAIARLFAPVSSQEEEISWEMFEARARQEGEPKQEACFWCSGYGVDFSGPSGGLVEPCPHCEGKVVEPAPVLVPVPVVAYKCDNCFDEGCPYCRPDDYCRQCGGNIVGQGGWCGYCDG